MAPKNEIEKLVLTSRLCPTQPGDARRLITHVIEKGLCSKRQREFYHRCHRCLYRGKGHDFVAPEEIEQRAGVGFTNPTEPSPMQMDAED